MCSFARPVSDFSALTSSPLTAASTAIISFKARYQSRLSALPRAPGGTVDKNAELLKQPLNVTEARWLRRMLYVPRATSAKEFGAEKYSEPPKKTDLLAWLSHRAVA